MGVEHSHPLEKNEEFSRSFRSKWRIICTAWKWKVWHENFQLARQNEILVEIRQAWPEKNSRALPNFKRLGLICPLKEISNARKIREMHKIRDETWRVRGTSVAFTSDRVTRDTCPRHPKASPQIESSFSFLFFLSLRIRRRVPSWFFRRRARATHHRGIGISFHREERKPVVQVGFFSFFFTGSRCLDVSPLPRRLRNCPVIRTGDFET